MQTQYVLTNSKFRDDMFHHKPTLITVRTQNLGMICFIINQLSSQQNLGIICIIINQLRYRKNECLIQLVELYRDKSYISPRPKIPLQATGDTQKMKPIKESVCLYEVMCILSLCNYMCSDKNTCNTQTNI
ncbi:hypothetical protein DAI22_01g435050 [Oryza sativa Japonica Group]|nr:hypothetical protein DAI22_01g435050 [Oryza sativa Japonica Group]